MFLTLGFKSVTMDDIAAELGISKKTIYQHYANKNELVEASTANLFETISGGVDRIREMGKNSIEEIFAIRTFMRQQLHNESAAPLYQLQKFFPKISATLRARQFEKMHGCMMQNIQRGMDAGIFRQGLNVEFVSRIYFTGLLGIKDNEVFPTDIFEVNELTKEFLAYHLRAICTEEGMVILNKLLSDDKSDLTKN